jgi:hypothetical protein
MEHTWTILNEKVLPELSGQTNVLTTIWFRLTTTDAGVTTVTDGRVNINLGNLDSFVPYEQITLQNRIGWIKGHAGDFYEDLNVEKRNL